MTQLGAASAFISGYGIHEDAENNLSTVGGIMGGPLDGNPQVGTGDIFVTKFSSSGVRQKLDDLLF